MWSADASGIDLTDTSWRTQQRQGGANIQGVRQRFDVHREEDEVIGRLAAAQDGSGGGGSGGGAAGDPAGMVNVDTVSEKIDVSVDDGIAQVVVRVRCERVVPVRGSADLFKKSAVVVTRVIEIDLMATEERRRLYDRVMARRDRRHRLKTEDTFALYQALMGLADSDQTGSRERLHIERLLDEQRASAARLVTAPFDVDLIQTPASAAAAAAGPGRRRHPPPQPPPRPSPGVITQTRNRTARSSAESEYTRLGRTGSNESVDTATSLLY